MDISRLPSDLVDGVREFVCDELSYALELRDYLNQCRILKVDPYHKPTPSQLIRNGWIQMIKRRSPQPDESWPWHLTSSIEIIEKYKEYMICNPELGTMLIIRNKVAAFMALAKITKPVFEFYLEVAAIHGSNEILMMLLPLFDKTKILKSIEKAGSQINLVSRHKMLCHIDEITPSKVVESSYMNRVINTFKSRNPERIGKSIYKIRTTTLAGTYCKYIEYLINIKDSLIFRLIKYSPNWMITYVIDSLLQKHEDFAVQKINDILLNADKSGKRRVKIK